MTTTRPESGHIVLLSDRTVPDLLEVHGQHNTNDLLLKMHAIYKLFQTQLKRSIIPGIIYIEMTSVFEQKLLSNKTPNGAVQHLEMQNN